MKDKIFVLEQMLKECRRVHLDTQAEALEMAIELLKDHEQHRRSWEEILAEERT